MGYVVAIFLAAFAGSHLTLVVGLARRRAWLRAGLALFVAPLAPWWGWDAGDRVVAIVWGSALGLYAAAVAVTGW
jgi:hypothetical protein